MPRLSADQWVAARIRWEADPLLTFKELGKSLGVSHAAVGQRAKKEGWERDASLQDVARRAQYKADRREFDGKLSPKLSGGSTKKAARELAEDIRADLIERHRADWAEHRQHFRTADIAGDFNIGKSAKIASEMLAIRQKGERAAYGLDEQASTQAPPEPEWTVLIGQKVLIDGQAR
ncbi:MAG: hypothetical protein ABS84_14810 [Rubrivivax sp. SCN 71-131]|nr:MAG: hypothetical protein ABS84_14810 [Rubrivivax sp. SCN 71-131]